MAEIVICGAGIAGIATAHELAVTHGLRHIVLVDERDPLSLTSDKSTEAYRNWWPGPGDAMVALMNRSIDRLETWARATNNAFNLNRRGYLYATADPARIENFQRAAAEAESFGAGPTRLHSQSLRGYQPAHPEGFASPLTGADIIIGQDLVQAAFPYLSEKTTAVVHARRCGWFGAQPLGMLLLEWAKERGVKLVRGRVTAVETTGGGVSGVRVQTSAGESLLPAQIFVNAAGPYLNQVGQLLKLDLPIFSELHTKLAFPDTQGVVPRQAPFMIWADPQNVNWSDEEREELGALDETRWMLDPFPAGIHTRPDGPAGSPILLMLWDYHDQPVEVVVPSPQFDEFFPELVLRGLATMLPGLSSYIGRAPRPVVDGGYYTKTRENRPLIGPLPVPGAYVIGALSGYGLMAAPAAAELLAKHITGQPLPHYALEFTLARYANPEYQALLANWGNTGQL
jgi:glycine/D-amino acid oxidase-like deaminating enzyme